MTKKDKLEKQRYQALRHFFRFLKERNAFEKYYTNSIKSRFKDDKGYTLRDAMDCIPAIDNFISSAFRWDQTQEGYGYWDKICHDWISYILKHNFY